MIYKYNYNNNIIYTTMSAGTDASILGYSNEPLFSGANSKYVNTNNNNNPLFFGSNEVPGLPGLSGAKNNVDAAQGKVPGVCLMKGGKRRKSGTRRRKSGKNNKSNKGRSIKLKTRIKIISGKYKMKNRKSVARLKNTLRKKYSLKNKKNKSKNSRVKKGTRKNSTKKMNKKSNRNARRTKGRRHGRKYKGGSGGIPFSGLPYPAGYAQYSNNNPNTPSYSLGGVLKASESALANPVPLTPTNTCVDNYDHYVKKGFASRGH